MPKLYTYADVGNYGLAHSMLAFARCALWSRDNDVPMLAPTWLRIKHRIGPMLRGERDKRLYHRLFRFPGYTTGLKRLALLATAPKFPVESSDLADLLQRRPRGIVWFRNLLVNNEEKNFHEIVGRGLQVRGEIEAITKPRYRPQPFGAPYIGLHVRMGDFVAVASPEKLRAGAKNARIPLDWYCAMLNGLRARLGKDHPAVVYSDGSDEDLAPLLRLGGVRRSPRQQSVSDMLSMSQGAVLVSSGSGFSMWGAYLGDQPRLCHPGQRLVRVLPQDGVDLEPEIDRTDELGTEFIERVRRRFGG